MSEEVENGFVFLLWFTEPWWQTVGLSPCCLALICQEFMTGGIITVAAAAAARCCRKECHVEKIGSCSPPLHMCI